MPAAPRSRPPPRTPPVLGRGNYAEGIGQDEGKATQPNRTGPVSVITSPIRGGASIRIPTGAKGPETQQPASGQQTDLDRSKTGRIKQKQTEPEQVREASKSGKHLSSTSSTKTFPFSVASATPSTTRSEGPDQAKTKTPNHQETKVKKGVNVLNSDR